MKGDRPITGQDTGAKCRGRQASAPSGAAPAWPGDPESIEARDVDFEAVAHVLANTCRRGGCTRRFLPLARHALTVSNEIEAYQGVPLLDGIAVEDRRALALHALPAVLLHIGEVVEDQEVVAVEPCEQAFESELAPGHLHALHQIGGSGAKLWRGAGRPMPRRSSADTMRSMSSPKPADRAAADGQPDLFDERGRMEPELVPAPVDRDAAPAPGCLTDGDLIALLREAGPSNVEELCAEVVSRPLSAAVPALVHLWQRFAGFGIEAPLVEQVIVLGTLARLEGEAARAALRGMVLSKGLPASLLPAALRAGGVCRAFAAGCVRLSTVGSWGRPRCASRRSRWRSGPEFRGIFFVPALSIRRLRCGGWRRSPWATWAMPRPGSP